MEEIIYEAKKQIIYGMTQCDILKLSEEELKFVTETSDIHEAVNLLKKKYPITLILVTSGPNGSAAFYKDLCVTKSAFHQNKTIETTGAGDTFCASAINYVLEHGIDNLSKTDLEDMLTFANAAASIITTKKGALRVMPEKQEVLEIISGR